MTTVARALVSIPCDRRGCPTKTKPFDVRFYEGARIKMLDEDWWLDLAGAFCPTHHPFGHRPGRRRRWWRP